MKEMNFDFGKDKVISVEENKSNVVITLSKDMIHHVKFVFEDCGIPGIVGPDVVLSAKRALNYELNDAKNEYHNWLKKDNDPKKCGLIAKTINNLNRKDVSAEEKRHILKYEVMAFCQKDHCNCYSCKEMTQKLLNVKNVLSKYMGIQIEDSAMLYFMSTIYPKIEFYGPENFAYHVHEFEF